ncbi:uncharacterized protein HMPREF1541_10041 [Cyphellophora europaea CBS 101466]|uniref:Uncharacterized protein n=1 Tax=Cyphellophora europaea (strain CBS 101466) TaxID=1220924 RepID=W2SB65_CYPE1|nr:uncharacterized protein HMPREF1541_10041 [Cyphellophora europaea CBS 101466]ETN45164.1 hypothetical protein HMPREF1541_10041 [Cyphellophora europaea CBS 101466]
MLRLPLRAPRSIPKVIRVRHRSSESKSTTGKGSGEGASEKKAEQEALNSNDKQKPVGKTSSQLDEDMRRAMEGLAGDGGEAGLELENGKPVAMKRGVRDNMFRYI